MRLEGGQTRGGRREKMREGERGLERERGRGGGESGWVESERERVGGGGGGNTGR